MSVLLSSRCLTTPPPPAGGLSPPLAQPSAPTEMAALPSRAVPRSETLRRQLDGIAVSTLGDTPPSILIKGLNMPLLPSWPGTLRPPVRGRSPAPSGQSCPAVLARTRRAQAPPAHLSLALICSALASIRAPMSPIPFPLMSTLVREVLLPRALMMMVTSVLSFESARDKDCRGCGGDNRQHSQAHQVRRHPP